MPHNGKRRNSERILGRNESLKLLEPLLDDLQLAIKDGLAHFVAEKPTQLVPYRNRTKANMLNDAIIHFAASRLEGKSDVVVDRDHDGTFFIVHGELGLRIKKLNRKDKTSNAKTERQRKVDQQLELDGIGRLTIVSLGYTVNAIWTNIVEMKIFCEIRNQRAWTIQLTTQVQAPLFEISPDQFDEGPRVRSTRKSSESEGTA